jgi:hypothetical protein
MRSRRQIFFFGGLLLLGVPLLMLHRVVDQGGKFRPWKKRDR